MSTLRPGTSRYPTGDRFADQHASVVFGFRVTSENDDYRLPDFTINVLLLLALIIPLTSASCALAFLLSDDTVTDNESSQHSYANVFPRHN